MAVLKSLVSVAWADGTFADAEKEMVDALIAAFEASDEEAKEIRDYAGQKRSLDDMPIFDLNADDRRVLLQHAVLLTYVDGEQHEAEKDFIGKMCKTLEIPDQEAQGLIGLAEERAKRFLNLL
ncbi:MAG: TerB family tellurite resistance protein [Polyangiaceae bacterium]|nr:TerB family tellurite resistance protein [Polyangiaceae bacterium]